MERAELLKTLGLSRFVAFDFETTGLDSVNDRVIEVSAIRFVDGEVEEKYTRLVNPNRRLTPVIIDITGITDDMLRKAPQERSVSKELIDFIGNDPIAAHNLSFDLSFLSEMIKRNNLTENKSELIDTLFLARIFMFNEPSFSLGSLSESFGFPLDNAHRAEYDAINCGKLLIEMVEVAAGYPLDVISQILEVIKPHDIFNKFLYVNLGNALIKQGDPKSGLVAKHDYGPQPGNYFETTKGNDISTLSPKDVFAEKGFLSRSKQGYEYRPGQVSFSDFAIRSFEHEPAIGIAEAGTGLGKSMAYLFPAIRKAQKSGNPVVISCHTKHLQDQLFHNDLPQLVESISTPVQASMLKGRSNYICKTRFNWLVSNSSNMLSPQEAGKLIALIPWLSLTKTGDMSECGGFWNSYPGRLATLVQSEPGYCTTSLCQRHHGCFFGSIKQRVFNSDLIIVNHALLLSQTSNEGLLPYFDTVIIDEGHNLVNVAYDQFSAALDLRNISNGIKKLDPGESYNSRMKKILTALSQVSPVMEEMTKDIANLAKEALNAGETLFRSLYEDFQIKYSYKSSYTRKVIMDNIMEAYGPHIGDIQWFSSSLLKLGKKAQDIYNKVSEIDPAGETYSEFFKMLEFRIEIINGLISSLAVLTEDQKKDWVYWQESDSRDVPDSRKGYMISLNASPVDISSVLGPDFFDRIDHCLVTSATLRVNDSFNYFFNRTGINGKKDKTVETEIFNSPFNYEDQVTYLQYGGNQPVSEDPQAIADYIYRLYQKQYNRIMVLFTARSTLENVYHALRNKPEGRDLPLFAQIRNSSRFALVQGMKKSSRGILLGTNAFWEGIDFPGDLLETLVITKLPFDVPTEPIVQAYSQFISKRGGNPFQEFSIPECIIRFRQGFGRLIRTTFDEGTFIVLDNRLVTKSYGSQISDAIPVRLELITDLV